MCCSCKQCNILGKPHTRIGLLFTKAICFLKRTIEKENIKYKELFKRIKELKPIEITSENVSDDEASPPCIINDFNDTKKLTNQLISTMNPQELVKAKRGKLLRQLSIYSHPGDNDTNEFNDDPEDSNGKGVLRSTSGLFRARLSPIKLPNSQQPTARKAIELGTHDDKIDPHVAVEILQESVSTADCTRSQQCQRNEIKIFESCCSDSIENTSMVAIMNAQFQSDESKKNSVPITVVKEDINSVNAVFQDHSFSMEKFGENPLPSNRVECDQPFETARFQKQQQPQPISSEYSQTEREFGHSKQLSATIEEESQEDQLSEHGQSGVATRCKVLKEKNREKKNLIRKQNVQLGSLLTKCEMQSEKIKKLKVFIQR